MSGSKLRERRCHFTRLQKHWRSLQFVGNSFTYFNDLPGILAGLLCENASSPTCPESVPASAEGAAAEGAELGDLLAGKEVSDDDHCESMIASVTVGGRCLKEHAADPNVLKLLSSTCLDSIVVLQDHSCFPGGADPQQRHDSCHALANFFSKDHANCAGQRFSRRRMLVVYATWAHQDGSVYPASQDSYPDFPSMARKTEEGALIYADVLSRHARNALVRVAFVGRAFSLVRQRYPEMFPRLYVPDMFHPSRLGSFLAACVIYATLTGYSPCNTSYIPTGCKHDHSLRKRFPPPWEPEKLSADDAVLLRRIAHDAVWPPPTRESVVKVPRHLLSRLLYTNPVCFLSVAGVHKSEESVKTNIMTLSWLTPTDNRGNFFFSIKRSRASAEPFMSKPTADRFFGLSIAVSGCEELLCRVGGISARDMSVGKSCAFRMSISQAGWVPFESNAKSSHGGDRNKSNSDSVSAGLFFVKRAAAHLLCIARSVELSADESHLKVSAEIVEGYARDTYWRSNPRDGPAILSPRCMVWTPSTPPLLSFLGSKKFSEVAGPSNFSFM